MYIKENKMRQTITGNTAFIKKTVLPMTKQAGIKKVSVKILPAHLPDDKEKMEVSFDVDKETNDNLLDLLKKKAGKKGTKKRQNLNLTVTKELLSKIIKKEIQKLKKESINEAVSVNVDKLLKNPKIKKIMQKLDIKKTQSKDAALKILNYFAVNPHALVALKKMAFGETVDESGILYKAGVKKYGKEGMRKIQQAAGKRKSHAEIGAIKDKYEKDKKESVNETWNQLRTNLISILKRKQHQKIDGVLVDMQTANVILKVWDALNSSNRKKFEKLPIKKMADVAWKLMK